MRDGSKTQYPCGCLKKPTAVYLASFRKLCQRQKPCFHRFSAIFSGFYAIFLDFCRFQPLLKVRETLDQRGRRAFQDAA
jgi:hypothetical protein